MQGTKTQTSTNHAKLGGDARNMDTDINNHYKPGKWGRDARHRDTDINNNYRPHQLDEHQAWHAADAGSTHWGGKRPTSQAPFRADSLTVFAQPLREFACINISVHVKNPKHRQPCHCVDSGKYGTH